MSQQLWTLDIDTKIDGHPWAISVTMSEQSLLTMMVNTWPLIESNVKRAAAARPGQLPHGLIDDVLVLLRCLVLRRLEPHIGPNLKINKG